MPTLLAITDSITQSGDQFLVAATEDWSQGRTLYGGMTTALCAVVAQRALPDLPPLRSAQVSFVGPASGQLRLTAATLRQGKSSTIVSVDCAAETGLAARALFTYGADRTSQIAHDLTAAPAVQSPEQCAPFFPPAMAKTGFFQNFEMKLAAGLRPMSGGGAPEFTVWVRHRDDDGVDPVIALLALADSLPPAAMIQFPAPAPISTMTWMIDLFQPVARGDNGWYLLRSRSEQAADGYSFQAMDVWDDSGRRVAVGRQVVALFT